MSSRMTNMSLALITMVAALSLLPTTSQAGFPLPHISEVDGGEKMAVDGTWLLTANSKRVRIEAGRAYALDGWIHLFVHPVEPEQVVLKDIVYIGNGSFAGEDLPLSGRFNAKIQPNGDLLFTVGLIPYVFVPVELDDPVDYLGLMVQAGLDPENSPYLSNWIAAEKRKRELNQELGDAALSDGGSDDDSGSDGGADSGYPEGEPITDYPDEYPVEDPVADEYPGDGGDEYPSDGFEDPAVDEEEFGEDGDFGEEELVDVADEPKKLRKVKATVHGKVKPKRIACTGRNLFLSGGACYSCPADYKRASLTRPMTHPKACQMRGLPKHSYTSATYQGKARPIKGCPGKNNYRSDGGCFTCPKGFKRASLGRKMNHPRACQSRGLPKHQYTGAKMAYKLDLNPLPCPSGQFKHAGMCKSCPDGTQRVHVLGADTGYCVFIR